MENGLTFPKAKIEPDNAGSNLQAAQKEENQQRKAKTVTRLQENKWIKKLLQK